MSIAQRKQEEKQEMHKRILNGARKIFLKKGYKQTSIRNIANEISYSPGSIYFYFKDKSEIFHELHKEGFQLLLGQLRFFDTVRDPFERLKALGSSFIQFAKDHTDYYNLMFLVDERDRKQGEGFQIAKEAIDYLTEVVRQCQEKGHFKNLHTDYFTFMVLSTVHGICSLFCKDRTASFMNRTDEELMQHGYGCFVALLERG